MGKMMILEAKKMGFVVNILDPAADCPAHSVADEHIVAAFDDGAAFKALAAISDVVTYELEHLSVPPLQALARAGHKIYPSPDALMLIQNKLTQKARLQEAGLPVPAFTAVYTLSDIEAAARQFGFPLVLKTCMGGYDGKGNAVIRSAADVAACHTQLGGGAQPLMAEQWVPFAKEISVLTCRGVDGDVRVYPVAENKHMDNILIETRVPAGVSEDVQKKAKALAAKAQTVFEGVGMFCVEMFVTKTGDVLINEIAPRPHNSGHYTIEACPVSQFAQHIRAVAGLPLGDSRLLTPAVMGNLLGAEGYRGEAVVSGAAQALALDGYSLHIYGKKTSAPKRKMGHFTVVADTVAEACEKASYAHQCIKILGDEKI